MIDLATCTLEEAQAATDAALAADPYRSDSDPTLPVYQWATLHELNRERQQFEAGDRMALFAAIRKCANHDLPLPAWAATAYIAAYDHVLNCRAKSWDEVFGTPYPKGVNLNAMRKRRILRFRVYRLVTEILQAERHTPIGVALFERVGREMRPPIGKSEAAERYYEAMRLLFGKDHPRRRTRRRT